MNVFTEVYDKSVAVLKGSTFEAGWSDRIAGLKALLEPAGPSVSRAGALDNVRAAVGKGGGKKGGSEGMADAILKACLCETVGYQERAALIKTMQHFYLVAIKGSQSIWVVDSPQSYTKWTYDYLGGKPLTDLRRDLKEAAEAFGPDNRKMMSDALQLARKWSTDLEVKLAGKDAVIKRKIKRWFHESAATDEQVTATAETLLAGFKRISATCNSNRVIFSDRPHMRADGGSDNVYASVNAKDVMPVIYIFQLFLSAGRRTLFGNIPKLWLCALTIVHELSHKLLNTDDIRYDDDGLKPGAGFTSGQALVNADSWGYFAADAVGVLSSGTIKKVWR